MKSAWKKLSKENGACGDNRIFGLLSRKLKEVDLWLKLKVFTFAPNAVMNRLNGTESARPAANGTL